MAKLHKQQPEFELQKMVALYLNTQHPKVRYMSDTIAFLKLNVMQAVRNKSIQDSDFHCPDLLIFAMRKGYGGLFIELKAETPFKQDGELKAGQHLKNQQATIDDMNKEGYKAMFAWDFDQIKSIIDDYLKL